MMLAPFPEVDTITEELVDEYFDNKYKINKIKTHREDHIIKVIKDLINSPKGVVPDSVYELIPDFEV